MKSTIRFRQLFLVLVVLMFAAVPVKGQGFCSVHQYFEGNACQWCQGLYCDCQYFSDFTMCWAGQLCETWSWEFREWDPDWDCFTSCESMNWWCRDE